LFDCHASLESVWPDNELVIRLITLGKRTLLVDYYYIFNTQKLELKEPSCIDTEFDVFKSTE